MPPSPSGEVPPLRRRQAGLARSRGRGDAVVALIDDLQWADHATLECLAFLARNLGDAQIVLIAAVRSDDIERDVARLEPIVKLRRDATAVIDLQPLGAGDMQRLLAVLWPQDELPARRRDRTHL